MGHCDTGFVRVFSQLTYVISGSLSTAQVLDIDNYKSRGGLLFSLLFVLDGS